MSLTRLVNEEVVRKAPSHGKKLALKYTDNLMSQFQIAADQKNALADALVPLANEDPTISTQTSNVLDALTKYIPIEMVSLYIAACSTMAALKASTSTQELVYFVFVGCTPVLFLLLFFGKRRQAGQGTFPSLKKFPKEWPVWKLFASAVAFSAWALVIPTTPYLTNASGRIMATFIGLVVSTLLNIFGNIFDPKSD